MQAAWLFGRGSSVTRRVHDLLRAQLRVLSTAPSSSSDAAAHEANLEASDVDPAATTSDVLDAQLQELDYHSSLTDEVFTLQSAIRQDDVFTVAKVAGANLAGYEAKHFNNSFDLHRYPVQNPASKLYPDGCIEDVQLEVLRRMNISMPCKKNQRIFGVVYAMSKSRVWVDVGHSSLAIFSHKELTVENIVESQEPAHLRTSAHDIRVGDKFIFRVQELKSPLGGIWLEPHDIAASTLKEQIWAEIEHRHVNNETVQGRILNELPTGYAVGIAGFVGVLPFKMSEPRLCAQLGTLQDFKITGADRQTLSFNVAHAAVWMRTWERAALNRTKDRLSSR